MIAPTTPTGSRTTSVLPIRSSHSIWWTSSGCEPNDIAVLLQRDTGGNLAEILDGTANVIRERLRILGDVRALTAQSRLSASILAILPVCLAVFILTTAPDYMDTLLRDQSGRYLLAGAALLQLVGYLIMRRIAQIKV